MKCDFFFIPGLGMNVHEVSLPNSSFGLQNPGFGDSAPAIFDHDYRLEDVAEFHLSVILSKLDESKPLTLSGMSLGGMVLSILASKFRHHLPKDTHFVFYVTSANSKTCPLLDKETLKSWAATRPGNVADFTGILRPFFSPEYLNQNAEVFSNYVEYRAIGKNQQSPKAYMLQLGALLKFDGDAYFPAVDASSAIFIYGEKDSLVNDAQVNQLRSLIPSATHRVISGMGHMITMERPDVIRMKGELNEIRNHAL